MIEMTTRLTRAQLTTKLRNGSLNTKNPTSRLNWGSLTPKLPPWRNRIQFCHSPMVPDAAMRATTTARAAEMRAEYGDHSPVAPDQLVVGLGGLFAHARQALGRQQVDPQHDEEDGPERHEQADLDGDQGRPHGVLVDRVEPQVVGV